MKKVILFFLFAILSLNSISANEVKTANNLYKQTQIVKTVSPSMLNYKSTWIKQDTTSVVFDFLVNKKIVINEPYFKNEYKIIKMDTINYDNGKSYIMKGIDSKNKKYDIEVLFFNDNSTIFIVAGEYDIIRYKFIN